MSIGSFDVELNGVKYNLSEDGEGAHYQLTGEPLRPPNAVTVQGESSQTFQMRQDALLWSLTDWSGGEGQIKFNAENPNRWRELTGVRVFERPGTLQPGYYVEDTQLSGASDIDIAAALVIGAGSLWALDVEASNAYEWDDANEEWDAWGALSGVSGGVEEQPAGDNDAVYFVEQSGNDVFRWDGSGTPDDIGNAPGTSSNVAALGDHVYSVYVANGEVHEHNKVGSVVSTDIDAFGDTSQYSTTPLVLALDGKVYVMVAQDNSTQVREITPTTAAGTGFGAEIARISGFRGKAMWAHSGTLFLYGSYETARDRTTVLYLTPGGEYGSLGDLRSGYSLGTVTTSEQATRLLDSFFVASQLGASGERHPVYQVESTTGGLSVLAINEDGDAKDESVRSAVAHNNDVFWGVPSSASTKRIMRARSDQYTKSSEAVSPWHDFALANEKILSSLVLSCEKLPADWTVYVDYAVDGDDTWTNAIEYDTTDGKGERVAVSTDSSTATFGTLSIRVRMEYTGAGIPESGPVVLGVDVNAIVNKPVKVWSLMLDLSDDRDRPGGFSGARKTTNVTSAGDSEKVVAFKDGYQSATPGVFKEHDVVIDTYQIVLSTPGEGLAAVKLRETV